MPRHLPSNQIKASPKLGTVDSIVIMQYVKLARLVGLFHTLEVRGETHRTGLVCWRYDSSVSVPWIYAIVWLDGQ